MGGYCLKEEGRSCTLLLFEVHRPLFQLQALRQGDYRRKLGSGLAGLLASLVMSHQPHHHSHVSGSSIHRTKISQRATNGLWNNTLVFNIYSSPWNRAGHLVAMMGLLFWHPLMLAKSLQPYYSHCNGIIKVSAAVLYMESIGMW